ncbi:MULTISPECIES: hypothetical protein [unclassified Sphingomonas]|uniref:hypothetical protein n=1 Tax=unclassified Sphingomonas TaxID=196159 RepID=UPI002150E74B|nr:MULTISPECIES: hypothetical protein [unclassified Sphingomonas]MCR5870445.1 hypothetical protein [Sphingomonas sp. J344]UUY01208.1 hypothetical protein LRS08_09330 [Sphingomonas sp. J315]
MDINLRKVGCAVGCLGMAGLLILSPGLLFGLALWAAGERTVYARALSPDGSNEARVQFDDCGAPCGWSKAVFIKKAWFPPDTPGWSCRAFLGDGTDRVRLEWDGPSNLIVHHGFFANNVVDAATTCGAVSIGTKFDPQLKSDVL